MYHMNKITQYDMCGSTYDKIQSFDNIYWP